MPAVAENKTQNSPEPESQSIDALQVENLHFTYPPRRKQPAHKALNGVSLIVPAGNAVRHLSSVFSFRFRIPKKLSAAALSAQLPTALILLVIEFSFKKS